MIHYGCHQISEEDIQAVVETLRSSHLTQGPKVPEFERALAHYCQTPHALAVSNGTAALHLACLALGLSAGDRVWTSPISFVASANCARYCGADVDFVDIDPRNFNICPQKLEKKLAIAQKQNALPKVLIAVHFAGQSCEMEAIQALAKHYDIKIIEDSAHALGGEYHGRPVGCCQFSDCATFSFHPVKSLTTAEGGAITTQDPKLFAQLKQLRSHGVEKHIEALQSTPHGAWYYEQQALGFNYRMSDLHAALGLSQITRLNDFIEQRQNIANIYHEQLNESPYQLPSPTTNGRSAWHLFVVKLPEPLARQRAELHQWLCEHGVQTQVHYLPIYRHPYYQALGFTEGYCGNAESYYEACLSVPIYPSLSRTDQDHVIQLMKEATQVFV